MIAEVTDIDLSWVTVDDSPIQCENDYVDGIKGNQCPNRAIWHVYASGCDKCRQGYACDPCFSMILISRDDLMCEHGHDMELVHWEKITP